MAMKSVNLSIDGHILYVSSIDISLPKGPSINEREFCWGLQKVLGDRVIFLLPCPAKDIQEADEYRRVFIKKFSIKNPYIFMIHQIDFIKNIRLIIQNEKIDLIVTRLGLLPIGLLVCIKSINLPIAIKHLTGKKSIADVNDSYLGKILKAMIVNAHIFVVKRLLKYTIACDTPTLQHIQLIKNTYEDCNLDDIFLAENATNTERFKCINKNFAKEKCGLRHFAQIVGYVGGRPWERGGNDMISVAPLLIEKFPEIGFVIVGGGKGLQALKDKIKSSGLSEYFHCPGEIDYNDVPMYINTFDVGIAFDRPERASIVGNSNQKIRQYLSCGKPVVATHGGNDFIENENLGNVLDIIDNKSVFDALEYWLTLDEIDKEEHTRKAVTFARENFSIERTVRQRLEFWNNRL